MRTVEQSVLLRRSAPDVFAFACDYAHDAHWRKGIVDMQLTSAGPPAARSTMRDVLRFMGRRLETVSRVTKYEPGRKVAFQSTSGPIPVQGCRQVEAAAGRARFTYAITAGIKGFFGLAELIMVAVFRLRLAGDLAKLRAILEVGQPAVAAA